MSTKRPDHQARAGVSYSPDLIAELERYNMKGARSMPDPSILEQIERLARSVGTPPADLAKALGAIGTAASNAGASAVALTQQFEALAREMARIEEQQVRQMMLDQATGAKAADIVEAWRSRRSEQAKLQRAQDRLRIVSAVQTSQHNYTGKGETFSTTREFLRGYFKGCLWSYSQWTAILMIDERNVDLALLTEWEDLYARLCLGEEVDAERIVLGSP